MNTRARQVHQLLRTMNNWTPGPSTWNSNPLCRREDSGEAPSMTIQCPTCDGRGHWGKRGERVCARCKGRGIRVVDAYTGREVGSERVGEATRAVRSVGCDSCGGQGVHGNGRRCERCGGSGQREVEDAGGGDSALERLAQNVRIRRGLEAEGADTALLEAKERQYEQGSYAELEQALRWLNAYGPTLHSLTYRYVIANVDSEWWNISPKLRERIDECCELLAAHMPERIKVPRWAMDDSDMKARGRWANGQAQGERDAKIRDLHAAGMAAGKIAETVGVTRQRVQQIVRAA